MLIELTDSVKKLFNETASQLKGAARRQFQAQVVMAGRPSAALRPPWNDYHY
ncbi:hypothetical protein [Nostoc sp. CCY 9925]|uniref:hypothetical protein n=1 Tax=Nostoc sp. CCY 9925 TaxID=3103865 RepID=UPI0039C62DD5